MAAPERLPTAERQRQIAEAALRIISTQGVSRLTAAALAEQVGIADGTIFRHFKDKGEIIDAAISLFETALEGTFPSPDGEPLDRLGSFLVKRLALVRKHPELLQLAFNDRLAEAAGEEGAVRVERLVGRSVSFVHDCLVEAQARGHVTRDAPVMLLVWMVIGVVRGASTTATHRMPGRKALATASPKKIWTTLERFLRGTVEEHTS